MFNRYFSLIYDSTYKRKWLVLGLVGIATAVAVIGLRWVSFDNNIESMLPKNDEICRSMRFLRESNFSDKVILSLELQSSEHTTQDLIRAVDQLAASLGPPMITDVVSGIPKTDIVKETLHFLQYVPQLIDKQSLSHIEKQITPEGVQTHLRQIYRQLLSPGSTFMTPFLRSDPLGITSNILNTIKKLSSPLGYKVTIKNEHFISLDGRHAMLILKTPVVLTDGFGSRKLITYLQEQLKNLPDFVSADVIAGHLHTISNEDVIKRDIRLALIIAPIAFLFLFLCIFRDIRAIIIFLIPLASVLISIDLSFLVFRKLSYFIVGMGAVIAGIAVDYGIHVYMAIHSGGERIDSVKQVAKPVVVGALTTISVFAAFFFSSVQGYHQLAVFSIISIVLCLVYALLVLPHFLSGEHDRKFSSILKHGCFGKLPVPDSILVGCWGALMIAALISFKWVMFDSNIRQFDGSEPEIIQAEQKFHRVWGGQEQPAVFVVTGKTLEEALQRNEHIYRKAVSEIGEENFSSFAAIWPSKQTRTINAARWEQFWRQGREADLKKFIQKYGSDYHFSEDAFSPFFKNLYAGTVIKDTSLDTFGNGPEEFTLFEWLKERFVLKKQDGYQVLSFFPDEDRYITALSTVSNLYPETFIVSRKAFSYALSHSISSEIVFLSGIAVLLILVLTFLLLKNIKLAICALVPVISGIGGILLAMSIAGLSLNVPAMIATIVVVGLCIDYGIFMVYTCRYNLKTGTRMAVLLSAITTILGAGVLLFAQHPMLFSIGITLTTGVLAGYISSLIIVPSLYRLWIERGKEPLSCGN